MAFTLIELMVVLAIIATLASLLVTSVTKAKESVRMTQCLSNLRQIGIGFHLYTDHNNRRFPPAVTRDHRHGYLKYNTYTVGGRDAQGRFRGRYFAEKDRPLNPYVGNAEVFHCPEDKGQLAVY